MAHAGTAPRPGIPRIGVQFEIIREKGGGPPEPEDHRPWWRRTLDAIRNLVKVRVR